MRAQPMLVGVGAAAMQYSSLPAEVEAAVHVARRRCAVDGPPTPQSLDCLLHEGFHIEHRGGLDHRLA